MKNGQQIPARGLAALFFLLFFSILPMAKAVDPGLKELHSTEEIRHMPAEEAEKHHPVRLRGVITFFNQRIPTKAYRFLQDESGGIYFYMSQEIATGFYKPGQLVEMEGVTGQGEFAPVVVAHQIKIIGEEKLPAAKPVLFDALASGREDSQFVETQGIVHSEQLDPETLFHMLDLATDGGSVKVYASQLPEVAGGDLTDSEVRVRGVAITQFNQLRQLFDIGLMVPQFEDITIEKTISGDPFAIPNQRIKNILRFKWNNAHGHRVKVIGTITLRDADKIYVQDDTEGICVQTKQPGEFSVGDRVEVLGFPAKGDYTPILQSAVYRKLSEVPAPAPLSITSDEALSGAYDSRLVSMKATLLDRAQQSTESFLILQAGKFIFHAYLKGPVSHLEVERLKNGSEVLVTGICAIDPGNGWHSGPDWRAESFRVLMRSPADVVVLARPPWWTLPKLLVTVGILSLIILTVAGWVFLLRRRVHQQTKVIEEKLHAEAAIKARYVELFENANDVVFTHDLQGRMTSINKAGAKLLQASQEEILTRNLIDLIVEDQRPAARQWLDQVVSGMELPTADWDFASGPGGRLNLEINSRRIEQAGLFIEVEGIARDATERKRLEREILEVVNKEQQRLGHDLHDGVCQQLAAIAYRTHILATRLKKDGATDFSEAQDIGRLINDSLVQTRAVARGLFPIRLEAEGLISALVEFAASTSNLYHINCNFSSDGAIAELKSRLAMHVYYITQEAVTNAVKHARASSVSIFIKQTQNGILLTIEDNGIGFKLADCERTGMGIGIMRYRAKVIGASLDLKSTPGLGTKLTCLVHPAFG